jgi:endonuclease/exonuclease/phosphatase family metal-dependent hydrolase
MLGPLPSTAGIGKAITELHHGLFRSAFTGQANAILLGGDVRLLGHRVETLNPFHFRRAQSERLGLDWIARLSWGKERRSCQAAHARLPDGRTAWIGNLHATSYPPDQRLPDAEVLRAATFLDAIAEPGELLVLAGDFNVSFLRSRTLHDLTGTEWGFSSAGPGIDHVLVRGAPTTPVHRWPDDRRRRHGTLLSDHSPVEVTIQ